MLIKSLIAFSLAGMLLVIGIAYYYYGDEPRPARIRGIVVLFVYLAVIAIFLAATRLLGVI